MYTAYFGFREKPFKLVPNPEYLFLSKSHEIAMAHLTYATDHGEGFVVLTGEVGTGKTTLCRNYLERLDEQTESAYLFNPNLEYEQLLETICYEFGIATHKIGAKALLEQLYTFLIRKNAADKNVVLVIDEAQSLSIQNLELVRMLSNLETTRSKLLQIVLVGQPELENKLESYELRQLAQRISLSYHLAPLSPKDTQAYIRHRLGVASQQRKSDLFTTDACRMAYRFSKGIPRLINIVCDRALLTAYSHSLPKVTKRVMDTAIMEIISRGKRSTPKKRWPFLLGSGVCLLALILGAAVFLSRTSIRLTSSFEQSIPDGSLIDPPSTPAEKIFKVPDAGNAKARIAVPTAESAPAPPAPRTAYTPSEPSNPPFLVERKAQASPISQPPTKHPAINPDSGIHAQSGQKRMDELVARLEPQTSRKKAVATLLSLWQQPRPNADLIPAEVVDASFFEIAARQYGLRCYEAQNDWALVRRLNLPAIVAFISGTSENPVYLTLVGWHGQTLSFEDGQSGAIIESDFETIRPYMKGPAYIFWRNELGYDMIIGYGADPRAVSAIKTLLRQIGYDQIVPSPEFDSATRAAVLDFQGRHNLSVDAMVGTLTKIMLLQEAGTIHMPTLYVNNRPPS